VGVGALTFAPAASDAARNAVAVADGAAPVVVVDAEVTLGSSGARGGDAVDVGWPRLVARVIAGVDSNVANSAREVPPRITLATNAAERATTPTATRKMPMR
jgi:hypothetical protein